MQLSFLVSITILRHCFLQHPLSLALVQFYIIYTIFYDILIQKNLNLLFIVSSILQQSKISTRGLIVNVKTVLNRSDETTTDI